MGHGAVAIVLAVAIDVPVVHTQAGGLLRAVDALQVVALPVGAILLAADALRAGRGWAVPGPAPIGLIWAATERRCGVRPAVAALARVRGRGCDATSTAAACRSRRSAPAAAACSAGRSAPAAAACRACRTTPAAATGRPRRASRTGVRRPHGPTRRPAAALAAIERALLSAAGQGEHRHHCHHERGRLTPPSVVDGRHEAACLASRRPRPFPGQSRARARRDRDRLVLVGRKPLRLRRGRATAEPCRS